MSTAARRPMPVTHPGDRRAGRIVGIDLARCVAVLSMIVAHTSPVGIDLPAEYLTAPLFALLIGVSLALHWNTGTVSATDFVVQNAIRGFILIALGELLQAAYRPIDVVLQTLGVLVMVLAPLTVALHDRVAPTVVLGAALLVFAPLLMTSARTWLAGADPGATTLVGWLVSGTHYRLTSHLVFGLAGLLVARWLTTRGPLARGSTTWILVPVCAVVTITAYGLGRAAGRSAEPYSGTTWELTGSAAFAAGAVFACVALADGVRGRQGEGALAPFLATGRMALTGYAVQILVLAALVAAMPAGDQDDDKWWVLATCLVVVVAFCWLWSRLARIGPLEWLVRLPRHL